jgi:hypothetical protein
MSKFVCFSRLRYRPGLMQRQHELLSSHMRPRLWGLLALSIVERLQGPPRCTRKEMPGESS